MGTVIFTNVWFAVLNKDIIIASTVEPWCNEPGPGGGGVLSYRKVGEILKEIGEFLKLYLKPPSASASRPDLRDQQRSSFKVIPPK